MNTKGAIKWIKDNNIILCDCSNPKYNKKEGFVFEYVYNDKSKEVIDLLKCGEKFEADCIELTDENAMLKNYIKDLLDEKGGSQ